MKPPKRPSVDPAAFDAVPRGRVRTEATALSSKNKTPKRAKAAAAQQKVPPLSGEALALITARKTLKLQGDDEGDEDASDVVLGEPSPYDEPKDVSAGGWRRRRRQRRRRPTPRMDDSTAPTPRTESVSVEPEREWEVRPVAAAHGWDHESGVEGFSVDKSFVLRNKIPAPLLSGNRLFRQDKKEQIAARRPPLSVAHTKRLISARYRRCRRFGRSIRHAEHALLAVAVGATEKVAAGASASLVGGALALGSVWRTGGRGDAGTRHQVVARAVTRQGCGVRIHRELLKRFRPRNPRLQHGGHIS